MRDPEILFPRDHVGVYGIATRPLAGDLQLLCVLKARGPYLGLWDLPGGTPEAGETGLETLKREVFEETGLRVCAAHLLCWHRSVFSERRGRQSTSHAGNLYNIETLSQELPRSTGQSAPFSPNFEDAAGTDRISVRRSGPRGLTPFAQLARQLILKKIAVDEIDRCSSRWPPDEWDEIGAVVK